MLRCPIRYLCSLQKQLQGVTVVPCDASLFDPSDFLFMTWITPQRLGQVIGNEVAVLHGGLPLGLPKKILQFHRFTCAYLGELFAKVGSWDQVVSNPGRG